MALSRQPVIATIAVIRTPDDIPRANNSKGIKPMEPQIKVRHPVNVIIFPTYTKSEMLLRRSDKVETIKVHHLAPGRHEVAHKRRLPIDTSINFRQSSQLGV